MANDTTYTYAPGSGTTRDSVRLLIPDRVVNGRNPPAMFSDQEIALFLSEVANDVKLAAASACESVAMDEAKRQLSVSISSGMSISRSGASLWLQKAKQLRESASKVPWEFIDSQAIDIDRFGQDNSHYHGDSSEDD